MLKRTSISLIDEIASTGPETYKPASSSRMELYHNPCTMIDSASILEEWNRELERFG